VRYGRFLSVFSPDPRVPRGGPSRPPAPAPALAPASPTKMTRDTSGATAVAVLFAIIFALSAVISRSRRSSWIENASVPLSSVCGLLRSQIAAELCAMRPCRTRA
jgi:hypothetical protein